MPKHNDEKESVRQTTRRKGKRSKYNSSVVKKPTSNSDAVLKDIKKGLGIQCPICYNDLADGPISATKCGHVFCTDCIRKSLKIKSMCPKCRFTLRGSCKEHPLYLETGDN